MDIKKGHTHNPLYFIIHEDSSTSVDFNTEWAATRGMYI